MPGATIEVKTQQIFVNPPSGKIDIYGYGPPGPQGPPGPPGSGAAITWPVVAPANSTGNITFTPSIATNDIRGLQTPDTASWMRFWGGPPYSLWFRANSGPMTGGLNGSMTFDADRVDFRDSPGLATLATFAKTGHTFAGPLTVLSPTASSAANIYVGPVAGTAGDEGGQINFNGTTAYTTAMYMDRYKDMFRFVHGSTVVGGFVGTGYGFMNGTHPVHGTPYAALWRNDKVAGGEYALLQGAAGDTYINSAAGQALNFRIGNAEKLRIPASGEMQIGSGVDGIQFSWGPRLWTQDATWLRAVNMFFSNEMRAQVIGVQGTMYCTAAGNQFRLVSLTDGNHFLAYDSSLPNQSGEGSNGPRLNGYSSVWLHQEVGNKSVFLNSGGNLFLNSGNAYQTFSSREFKDNVESMDPEECLAMVRRWRPVRFDWKPEQNTPHPVGHGFISEEMYETTSDICAVEGELSTRPGWANGVDYAGTTPWLAGAVQALLERIEVLTNELSQLRREVA